MLLLGIFLLIAGFSIRPRIPSGSALPRAPAESTFASEPVWVDPSLLSGSAPQESRLPPVRIVIPGIGIDIGVETARIIGGYWEVFEDKAGFGTGSAYPQDTGNQVIFAHARDGLFLPLKSVKTGQRIYVMTKEQWYSYEVKEIKEVLPTQKEVIAPTADATLTLYTCTGFADSKRLIVVAKRSG